MKTECRIILLLGVLALVPVGSLQAQLIADYDFSAAQGYVDGPVVAQPAGGEYTWLEGVAAVPAGDMIAIADEALLLTQVPDTDVWAYFHFPTQMEGDLYVTWDWQYVGPADSNIDVGVNISDSVNFNLDGNPDLTWNEQGAMCRMQEANPIIDVRNGDWEGGGTYASLVELNYTDGALIHMRMVVHIVDLTLDVYAAKDGEAEVTLAEGYGFRRIPSEETNGVNCLAIWVDGQAETSCIPGQPHHRWVRPPSIIGNCIKLQPIIPPRIHLDMRRDCSILQTLPAIYLLFFLSLFYLNKYISIYKLIVVNHFIGDLIFF